MTKNQNRIIKYLLNVNYPITSSELANALNISTRSIKKYIQEINFFYHQTVISSSNTGYSIRSEFKSTLFISLNDEQFPQTFEERSFYIIKQLVLNNSQLDLFDLCDVLCIGYSSIKSIISKMNKNFSSYHVQFICKNDYIYIKGNEYDIRKLISYVINEESKNSYLSLNLLQNNFENINLPKLKDTVLNLLSKYNFYLNDFSLANLLLHLLIIINRGTHGQILITDNHQVNDSIKSTNESDFIFELKNKIEKDFDIKFNDLELYEIYMLFKSNANLSLNNMNEDLKNIVSTEIISLVNEYVKNINEFYMIDLSSKAFTTPFTLHLKNLIFRVKSGQNTNNPMVETIKYNCPMVFDIAIYVTLDLMNRFNIEISEEETAFLALHIGAEIERQNINKNKIPAIIFCPNYHELATSLFNTIAMNFGHQINILGTYSDEFEFSQINSHPEISIIFTTIPIHISLPNTEIIMVSPLNVTSQFEVIQNTILRQKEQYENIKLKLNFHNFFEKDLFVINPNLKTKKELLSYLCNTLKNKNYVELDFEEKVYQRENAATTAFGKIAIPHSFQMNAIKTCISVAISKKGIQWDTHTVHIVLLLAINKADKQTFHALYEALISLFCDNDMIQDIKNCTDFDSFKNLIYSKIEAKY